MSDVQMCSLRLQLADLFHDLLLAHCGTKLPSTRLELFISAKLVLRMYSIFFQRQTIDFYRFISKFMDVFCMAGSPAT